jgi:hypothetical protein
MRMSMLQTMMREHQKEVEDVRAEIHEAQEIAAQLRERLELNVKYFEAVCQESIRASNELFDALMAREQARIEKLRERHDELMKEGPEKEEREPGNLERLLEGPRTNGGMMPR